MTSREAMAAASKRIIDEKCTVFMATLLLDLEVGINAADSFPSSSSNANLSRLLRVLEDLESDCETIRRSTGFKNPS